MAGFVTQWLDWTGTSRTHSSHRASNGQRMKQKKTTTVVIKDGGPAIRFGMEQKTGRLRTIIYNMKNRLSESAGTNVCGRKRNGFGEEVLVLICRAWTWFPFTLFQRLLTLCLDNWTAWSVATWVFISMNIFNMHKRKDSLTREILMGLKNVFVWRYLFHFLYWWTDHSVSNYKFPSNHFQQPILQNSGKLNVIQYSYLHKRLT